MNDKKAFTGLYFGALPILEDLVGCLIEEENDEELNTIQPLGCREFIFTEPRVLLSPCLENGKQAFIICKGAVLHCSKFTALISKLQFKVVRKFPVDRELFQYCLAFTITQKLAPIWNKVGEYYVQGREFFYCKYNLNAVSFDVNITDRLCIGLKAYSIKLHPAKADHFCSSSNILQNLLTQRIFEIQQDSIQDDLCFVLPSLKKARVVGISHEIPPHAPFSCYEDLRKHWKLMYGYRLPPDESTFYNVRFFGTKVFTYPASCIHSNYPHISPRCDQQAIFQAFLQDVQIRIPFICEIPLRLTSSALYSSNKLHSAVSNNKSSLTRTVPSQFQHCTPFVFSTNQSQNRSLSNTTQTLRVSSDSSSSQSQNRTPASNRNTWNQMTGLSTYASYAVDGSVTPTQAITNAESVACNNTNGFVKEMSRHDISSDVYTAIGSCQSSAISHVTGAPVSTISNTGPRIIPTFTKRVPQKPVFQRKKNKALTPKVCPVFKSKVNSFRTAQKAAAQSKSVHNAPSSTIEPTRASTQRDKQSQQSAGGRLLDDTTTQPEVVTQVVPQCMSLTAYPHSQVNQAVFSLSQNYSHRNQISVEINRATNRVVSHARKLPEVRPGLSLSRSAIGRRSHIPGNLTERPSKDYRLEAISKPSNAMSNPCTHSIMSRTINLTSSLSAQSIPRSTGTNNNLLTKPKLSNMPSYVSGSSSVIYGNRVSELYVGGSHIDSIFSPGNGDPRGSNQGTPYKRQMGTSDIDTVVQIKKPRSKPKVQDDVDVRQLALNNQLKKVNTITLIEWLRKYNVPVKQKDKKGELMEKVMNILNGGVHEV